MRGSRWRMRDTEVPSDARGLVAPAGPAAPLYAWRSDGRAVTLHELHADGTCTQTPAFLRGGAVKTGPDGSVWSADPEWSADAAELFGYRPGRCGATVLSLRRPEGWHHPEFLGLNDGFVLAWRHEQYAPRIRVERRNRNGKRRWVFEAQAPTIDYPGITQVRRETGWRPEPVPPWRPEELMLFPDATLLVSGGRLLVNAGDVRSGVVLTWCLELRTGAELWQAEPRAGNEWAAATRDGGVLLGAAGYDEFATVRYDPGGAVRARWPSAGAMTVSSRGRVRLLERHTADRAAFARRLHRNGTMTDGPELPGSQPSDPLLCADGRLVFWCADALYTLDADMRLERRLRLAGERARDLTLMDGGVLALVVERGSERSVVLVDTDLPPLDPGPWPGRAPLPAARRTAPPAAGGRS